MIESRRDEGGREPERVPGAEAEAAEPSSGEPPAGDPAPEPPALRLEGRELRKAVEAILFSLSEPIGIRALSELLGVSVFEARQAVEDLRLEYFEEDRAFRIEDIANGVQILTVKTYDPWIRKLRAREREGRLSPAALETLAVIAYKQPIHRADLEAIRGVNCGPILKTLLDRGLVKVVGRGEGLGRPLLYGTTRRFLESFGIASVKDLPQPDSESPPVAPAGEEAEDADLYAPGPDEGAVAGAEGDPAREEGDPEA